LQLVSVVVVVFFVGVMTSWFTESDLQGMRELRGPNPNSPPTAAPTMEPTMPTPSPTLLVKTDYYYITAAIVFVLVGVIYFLWLFSCFGGKPSPPGSEGSKARGAASSGPTADDPYGLKPKREEATSLLGRPASKVNRSS